MTPYHVAVVRYKKPSDLRVVVTESYITRLSSRTIRKQYTRAGFKVLSVRTRSGYD